MTPADLEGLVIGPVDHHVDRERVAAFVEASGDDADRWVTAAPPGYAAVLLFAVAAEFLWDPRIATHTKTLIHVDQQFTYPRALTVGTTATITGTVGRVRERSGAWFVTFTMLAEEDGDPLVTSRSTFLMSDQPAAAPGRDPGEPSAAARAAVETAAARSTPASDEVVSLAKSASRADLVRYAAASGDFNPLHWDHGSARTAGLDGVVVHGLLMHAWLSQLAASVAPSDTPVATVKTRFRSALRPALACSVRGWVSAVDEDAATATMKLVLRHDEEDLVTAAATVRTA